MTEQKLLPCPWHSKDEEATGNPLSEKILVVFEETFFPTDCKHSWKAQYTELVSPTTLREMQNLLYIKIFRWCYIDDLIAVFDSPTGDVQILVEGLEEMARQKTIDEFEEEDKDNGDYMYAYDYIVNKARKTLAAYEASKKGGAGWRPLKL